MELVSNFTADSLAGKPRIYLDPEISGEGMKIRMDDSDGGEIIGDPAPKIVYPDLSQFKPLRKYFNRTGYQVYPTWIYNHKTGDEKIVKNAAEASSHGVIFRETTMEERAAFGVNFRWDYEPNSEWRTKPIAKKRVVDPDNMEGGKNFVARRQIETTVDHDALISRTVAAVMVAMNAKAPAAPANVDPVQWKEYQEFLAFREATKAVAETAVDEIPIADEQPEDEPVIIHNMTGDEDPRAKWLAEASRLGIKVDGRWSTQRLIEECQKAG